MREYASSAYDSSLYHHRQDAEGTFKQFLDDPAARAILFVGRAGAGKSALLAHLYDETHKTGAFAGWYQASTWQDSGDLRRALAGQLPLAGDGGLEARLAAFVRVIARADVTDPSVIFIDGVNENDQPDKFVQEELNAVLLLLADVACLRVVVSCREETFERHRFDRSRFWTPPPVTDGTPDLTWAGGVGQRPDDYAIRLGDFTPEQIAQMWLTYANRFETRPRIFDELPRQARELAKRNPLMLRLVAEAFQTTEVPPGVSSLVLFRRYFDIIQGTDPRAHVKPTSPGEAQLLRLLVDLLADVDLTRDGRVSVRPLAPLADLRKAAERHGVPWTAYETLFRKGVLHEKPVPSRVTLGTEAHVGFVFERMFEFALARRLHGQGAETPGTGLERVMQAGLTSAALWGAARTLILLEIEEQTQHGPQMGSSSRRDPVAWLVKLLTDGQSRVRGLVTDALVQLGLEDPSLVSDLCQRLLAAREVVAKYVAVAVAVQLGMSDVLLHGCALPDRQTRRRAAQGLVYFWQQDRARGEAAWRRLGEQASVEIGNSVGNWLALIGTSARIGVAAFQHGSLSEGAQRAEREIPSFLSLLQVCFVAHALSLADPDVSRPLKDSLQSIIGRYVTGRRGDLLNAMTKHFCTQLYADILRKGGLYDALKQEIEGFSAATDPEDVATDQKTIYVTLANAWDDDSAVPLVELQRCMTATAQGGVFASFLMGGALIARLRQQPDEASELARGLMYVQNERAAWAGFLAARYLVPSAMALRVDLTAEWFTSLMTALDAWTRSVLRSPNPPPSAGQGLGPMTLDLEHVFLARVMTGGDLIALVRELHELVHDYGHETGEVEMIHGLAVLYRLGYPLQALNALELWGRVGDGDGHDPEVLDALADVLAEMLAAYPASLEGWLERTGNPTLEAKVREKLLGIDPEHLVYQYGVYIMITLASRQDSARQLGAVMRDIVQSAQTMDDALNILGDEVFDLHKTPF